MLTYSIILTPESDGSAVNVHVPAMPNVLTWDWTMEEAIASAREAITLHLESYIQRNHPFPQDPKPSAFRTAELLFLGLTRDVRTHKLDINLAVGTGCGQGAEQM